MAAGLFAGGQTLHHSAQVIAQAAQEAVGGIPNDARTPFTPFTGALPSPQTKTRLAIGNAPCTPGDVFHGIAPEFFDCSVSDLLETFLRMTGTSERQRFANRIGRCDEFMRVSAARSASSAGINDVWKYGHEA